MKTNARTHIEFFLVMLLLILFGVSTFSLVAGASTAYSKKTMENQANDSLRLASAYLQSKINQSSNRQKISILPNPVNNKMSVRISEDYDAETFYTWIYFDNGKLKEAFIGKDIVLDNSYAFDIAEIDSFEISQDDRLLIFDLSTKTGEKKFSNQIIIDLVSFVAEE